MRSVIYFLLIVSILQNNPVFAQESNDRKAVIAMHLLDYTSDEALERLSRRIPEMASKGVNLIFLEVDYNFEFESHPELIQGTSYITLAGARRFTRICRQYNISIVPQFQCLGHQSWAKTTYALLSRYPELDLTPGAFPDNEGLYCREWDIMNPKVNEIVLPMMDEIISAFQADGIHIGMDEIFLLGSPKSPSTAGKDPGELFAKAVNEFHHHFVKEKGLRMYMWGDRLIDGKKYEYGEWESSLNGTATAIDKIPTDIIICDWHYEARESYPSIPMFLAKGFQVLPCSYINADGAKALIKYSLRQQHPGMLGHGFTSWSSVPKDSILLYSAFVKGLEVFRHNLIWDVSIDGSSVNPDGTLNIILQAGRENLDIYYTTDGKNPDKNSTRYTGSFRLDHTATIKAVAYESDQPAGEIFSRIFVVHLATGKPITLRLPPSSKYAASGGASVLVNGITSTGSFSDGQWAGFEGEDIEAVINLGAPKTISEVSIRFINRPESWIYPALHVELWTSSDGTSFEKALIKPVKQSSSEKEIPVQLNISQQVAYVKVVIPKRIIPENAASGGGQPAWIFIDEVIVQ